MNTIIGTNAAKLAGLQIDMLQKLRNGSINLDQLERFLSLSTDEREMLFGGGKKLGPKAPMQLADKFSLFLDLGIITVPDDYVHETQLKTFSKRNRKMFCSYDDHITDRNYPNPTRIMRPGDIFRVCIFMQVVGVDASSLEHMAFLKTKGAVYTGAQGASLVFAQKYNLLPIGKCCSSFDEPDRLWENSKGEHMVPSLSCTGGGDFGFVVQPFEGVWFGADFFLCMTEAK